MIQLLKMVAVNMKLNSHGITTLVNHKKNLLILVEPLSYEIIYENIAISINNGQSFPMTISLIIKLSS